MSNIITLPRLDVTRLAADFSQSVRAAHTTAELKAIRDRNAAESRNECGTQSGVDHVDDFSDSNDLMADAIDRQLVDWSFTDLADEINDARQRAKTTGYRLSRILIGCEFSGTVRDAFAARGHSVMSCDVLPTESPGPHYQGDVRDIINDGWHKAILHPPCTYIAACQLWRCLPQHAAKHPGRAAKKAEAIEFVRDIGSADIDEMCVENPKSCIGTENALPGFDPQLVQPYNFGHNHSKETYLWRKGLAELVADPADYIAPRQVMYKGKLRNRWANQSPCGADSMGPSADRGHKRSKFFAGIANAMADQWGGIVAKTTAKATVTQLELFV